MCAIPHTSGNEEGIARHILDLAGKLGLATRRDEIGNVVVVQPATPGHESAPTLVLQGHMDMVGVAADGVEHDFMKDPIRPLIEGDFVTADGTTLGADNGIGGAIMLAIMEDPDIVHPEIEHFFTVNEEAGMDGAHALEGAFLKGRRLINLDTEEFGEIYISCAGGGDSVVLFPTKRAGADKDAKTLLLSVAGLKGGHSGCDIHLGRGSGNKILARLLSVGLDAAKGRIRTVEGGKKRNSISDYAKVVLDVPAGEVDAFRKAVEGLSALIIDELAKTDGDYTCSVTDADAGAADPLTADETRKFAGLLVALPHGVLAMSPEVEGLVETSTNMGTIEDTGEDFKVVCLTRSAVTSSLGMVQQSIRAIAGFVGARVEEPQGYPGWKPDMTSDLLRIGKDVHKELYGQEPAVKAIHAGLECGLFGEKLEGVDMISVGPDMMDVHSPLERLGISSTKKFYDYLRSLVSALA